MEACIGIERSARHDGAINRTLYRVATTVEPVTAHQNDIVALKMVGRARARAYSLISESVPLPTDLADLENRGLGTDEPGHMKECAQMRALTDCQRHDRCEWLWATAFTSGRLR